MFAKSLKSMKVKCLLVALAMLGVVPQAGAVLTNISFTGNNSITLQVGTPTAGAIDNVVFNVTGPNAGLTPTPVTNPASVPFRVTTDHASFGFSNFNAALYVNSSAGLACVGGSGCGATIIPFNSISWTVSDATSPPGGDIQNGSFDGSASQQIAGFVAGGCFFIFCSPAVEMTNTLTFTYANSTQYPAGQYRGRVVFTATLI